MFLPKVQDPYNPTLNTNVGKYDGTWFSRTFDPKKVDMSFNAWQSELARQHQSRENQLSRDFEREMSNTAYQRAVADLNKAGLNPYLAYSQGGASTPTASANSGAIGNSGSSSNSALVNSALRVASDGIKTLGNLGSAFIRAMAFVAK